MNTLKILLASLFFLGLVPYAQAVAGENPPVKFMSAKQIAEHQEQITQLEEYLSGLTTIVSDFMQIAPDGSLTNGKFFLQRPGRMRWQYNPPTPILMIADSKELVFYDYELEQETHIPLNSTMIGFLAQEVIKFEGFVAITEFEQAAGVIRIGLVERKKPTEGSLMLEFTDKPLALRNMVITDATGQRTSVALNNAKFGVKLDKELFIFRTPKKRLRRT